MNRADLLRTLGRESEAETSLREAIARHPADAAVRHTLGLSLIRQGKREEGLREASETARALRFARRLVELEPQDPRARALLADLEAPPAR